MAIKKVIDIVVNTDKANSALKKFGFALKALGIGIIVSAVASLTTALSRNQKVMNAVNSVFETVSIVFSKVATILVDVYESVAKSSDNFNALGEVLKGVVNLGLTPFKLAFFGIKLALKEAQLAWEQSIFGGKDKDRIKELTLSILETKQSLVDAGEKAIESGKAIVNNLGEAIDEFGNITSKVVEKVSEISLKSSFEQAKANVQLKNTAKLAVAEQARLVEQYDRLAEKQRQYRDDESKAISERYKNNEILNDVLDKQEKAMIRGANAQIASAQAELNKNNTIEAQVALTDALANKEGILAQIEGFRSEQLVNRIALQKEQIELDNSINDAEKQRQLDKLDFEAQIEENELLKNVKLQERLDLENEILEEDLERKRELYEEGTQNRADAEQEYLDKKQELSQKEILLEKKVNDDKIALEEKVAEAKSNIMNRTASLLIELAGKGSKLGKAIAVANVIRSGIEGTQNAYSTAQKSPITTLFPAYPIIQAGLAASFAGLQARQILSSPETGGSSSSGGGGGAQAPSFNLVQGTGTNQVAEAITGQAERPVRAYVVGSDVTTAESLERNRISEASI